MTPWPRLQMPSINHKRHMASAHPGTWHRRVFPLRHERVPAPRVAPLAQYMGEGGTGFVGLVHTTQPVHVLVLSAERGSGEETVHCVGERLGGFLEENLASSIKAGSDLDRTRAGGDSCRGRGNLEVGIAW